MDRDRPYQHLYNARWTRTAKLFLKQNPLCVYCKDVGVITAAQVVDHIIPHKGDLKLFNDPNNHQALCKPCHDGPKALEESRGFKVGCGVDGVPFDCKEEL